MGVSRGGCLHIERAQVGGMRHAMPQPMRHTPILLGFSTGDIRLRMELGFPGYPLRGGGSKGDPPMILWGGGV
jgi:hypothetical protein